MRTSDLPTTAPSQLRESTDPGLGKLWGTATLLAENRPSTCSYFATKVASLSASGHHKLLAERPVLVHVLNIKS